MVQVVVNKECAARAHREFERRLKEELAFHKHYCDVVNYNSSKDYSCILADANGVAINVKRPPNLNSFSPYIDQLQGIHILRSSANSVTIRYDRSTLAEIKSDFLRLTGNVNSIQQYSASQNDPRKLQIQSEFVEKRCNVTSAGCIAFATGAMSVYRPAAIGFPLCIVFYNHCSSKAEKLAIEAIQRWIELEEMKKKKEENDEEESSAGSPSSNDPDQSYGIVEVEPIISDPVIGSSGCIKAYTSIDGEEKVPQKVCW